MIQLSDEVTQQWMPIYILYCAFFIGGGGGGGGAGKHEKVTGKQRGEWLIYFSVCYWLLAIEPSQ
jgi:hypothetical protein